MKKIPSNNKRDIDAILLEFKMILVDENISVEKKTEMLLKLLLEVEGTLKYDENTFELSYIFRPVEDLIAYKSPSASWGEGVGSVISNRDPNIWANDITFKEELFVNKIIIKAFNHIPLIRERRLLIEKMYFKCSAYRILLVTGISRKETVEKIIENACETFIDTVVQIVKSNKNI